MNKKSVFIVQAPLSEKMGLKMVNNIINVIPARRTSWEVFV
jgi:hypothetical protein